MSMQDKKDSLTLHNLEGNSSEAARMEKAPLEYLQRIQNHYESFSISEKRIAEYILTHHEQIPNLSTQALAKEADTSPASVVRFCRSVGFKGYTELKFYIERELLSPSADTFQITRGESVKVIKQKVFNFNKSVLDETMMILDDESLERAIQAIKRAKRIDMYGEGGSGSIAMSAVNIFMQMGIPCNTYTDAFLQITAASQLHPGDVAIAFAHSGEVINTIDAIREAKKQGAFTIGITGYANSTTSQYLDIELATSNKASNVLSDLPAARISELAVISVIQMALLANNYEAHAGQIQKAKDIFKVKRTRVRDYL